MSKLLCGERISEEKLVVHMVYNLDAVENAGMDTSQGVVVEAEPNFPASQVGKAYRWCVNPQTKEQFFEEYDRPLTSDEKMQQMQDVVDQIVITTLMGGD